jgi:outer membrane lipoprotein-sorting protein
MKTTSFLLLFIMFLTSSLLAETPQQEGHRVFEEMDRRDQGFGDVISRQEMVLRNKHGQESLRALRMMILEGHDDGDRMMIVFEKPMDIKGTALLTHGHIKRDDDQWLYLPALGRVKRITGASKAGSFMGSEFSFEDLGTQEIEDYTYLLLGKEEYQGAEMFVVERIPADKKSGYGRQVTWIDQNEYRLHKVDFYDRKKTLLKTLTTSGYKRYLDKYWRPDRFIMVNHQTGKSTQINVSDYNFQTGLKGKDFTKNSLKRIR